MAQEPPQAKLDLIVRDIRESRLAIEQKLEALTTEVSFIKDEHHRAAREQKERSTEQEQRTDESNRTTGDLRDITGTSESGGPHLRQARGAAEPVTSTPSASVRNSGGAYRRPYLQPAEVRRARGAAGARGATTYGKHEAQRRSGQAALPAANEGPEIAQWRQVFAEGAGGEQRQQGQSWGGSLGPAPPPAATSHWEPGPQVAKKKKKADGQRQPSPRPGLKQYREVRPGVTAQGGKQPGTAREATRPGCNRTRRLNRGQPFGRCDQRRAPDSNRGQLSRATRPCSERSVDNAQQGLDPEANQRIRNRRREDEQDSDRASDTAQDSEEPPNKSKKRHRSTSKGTKKGDKRDVGDLPEAGTPGPSKKAKAKNGEQISMIVQECLKSMEPLLFAKSGGARETKGPGDTESREDQPPVAPRGKGLRQQEQKQPVSKAHHQTGGGEEASPTSATALPTQVWGEGPDKNARRRRSPSADGRAPEAYKRGILGRPYMVARAPGLASLIPLAVKERIWRREFIDIFTLLEIQVEGLDLTTVDKKKDERRSGTEWGRRGILITGWMPLESWHV
ncbi:hypothetical protein NDU88_004614 [Pleurodeles waltl]|uniref:Uncharacterized protein n=1 Tax=Pleurodeles waltl TaxID=8319 RepID=A0AAV7LV53_PLEWA|nr:hypothetical protein NDU88_004614 [Pleurodeles waltl]